MTAPATTYAAWVELLHRFERSDADSDVLASLERSEFKLGNEMADRLSQRIADAFRARVSETAKRLYSELTRASGDVGYGQIVNRGRHDLAPIARFSEAACWPPEVSAALKKSLADFVTKTQASLEENAASLARQDQGALLRAVRTYPLTLPVPEPSKDRPGAKPAPEAPLPTRRIIF